MTQRIYLACPYSHPDPRVREERFHQVTAVAAHLTHLGYSVFSPITYGHTLAQFANLDQSWQFWQDFCLGWIDWANELWILPLPGYDSSTGVKHETDYARCRGLTVKMLDTQTLARTTILEGHYHE